MAIGSAKGWVAGLAAWLLTVVVATVAQAGSYAYIPNDQAGTVSVVDATSGILVATVDVGDGPSSAVVSPDRTRAYVGNYTSQTISVIDTMTHAVLRTIPLASSPLSTLAVSPDNAHLYVPLQNATVAVVDTAAGTAVASVPVGVNPYSVALTPDGSTLYVPCYSSDRVDVVDTATRTVTASISITSPYGSATTPDGSRLYVASSNADAVAVVDTATNTVVASIPVGSYPVGVAVGWGYLQTRVYVTNTFADTVSVIDTTIDAVVKTINVGDYPVGVALTPDGSRLLVLNYVSDTISVYDPFNDLFGATLSGFNHPAALGSFTGYTAADTPQFVSAWGSTGAGDGQFSNPMGVAVDSSGHVYVADSGNNRVQKFDDAGAFLAKWGSSGSGDGQFNSSGGVAVDASGNVYVTDGLSHRIQKFDANGDFLTKWGSLGSGDGQFFHPSGVAVDAAGNVYVTDILNHRVQKFDANGVFLTKWGSFGSGDGQFDIPGGVAIDATGNVYVADHNSYGGRVQKFDSSGAFLMKIGSPGSSSGSFLSPWGVAVDASGNVYVSDSYTRVVQKFTANGVFVTMWGGHGSEDGRFLAPSGVVVDSSGAIYVADSYLDRIQKFAIPADLAVTFTDVPTFVNTSSGFSFVLDVANAGPQVATDVSLTVTLPSGVTPDTADPTQGSCAETGGVVTCDLGDVPAAGTVTVLLSAEAPAAAGAFTLDASVTSPAWDDDTANNAATAEITVNGAPTDLALSSTSVDENQPTGTVVGTFTTTDPNAADMFTYAFATGTGDTDNASFSIVGDELRSEAGFDYENKSTHSVLIRSTDQGGLTTQRVFTILVTDVNEAPTDILLSSNTVDENLSLEAPTCDLSITDSETGDMLVFDPVIGPLSVCIVWVSRVTVGSLSTADPDGGDTFTYALVPGPGDTDNASFNIYDGWLEPTMVFNYELKSSYTIRVRSTDQGGLWFEKAFTITVVDVNEAPTDLSLSPASIGEGNPSGTTVGTLSTSDPDAGGTFTYELAAGIGDADNGSFAIAGNTVQSAEVFDFESKNSYSIRVRSADQGGFTLERSLTIAIIDGNDAPTGVALSTGVVEEGLPAGTRVGTLTTTDLNAGNTFTYALAAGTGDTDNASFQTAGNQLQTAAALDFSVKNRYSVRVRSTDQGGLFAETVLTVTPPTYVLWTRSDTGRAAVWQLDPGGAAGSPRVVPLADSAYLLSTGGVGGPWQATSFHRESATEGYVLWTRSDTGQAALWQVDPSSASGTPKVIDPADSAYVYLRGGVGAGWMATSYDQVSASEAYVLWTRSATGQAALWRIDPGTAAGTPKVIGLADSAYLYLTGGVGAGWTATSYTHVNANEGYVLWTRSATGQAALWRIDPSTASGTPKVIGLADSAYLYLASGVGAGWQATGYDHVSATEGYVLWTRGATGQAALWKINPGSGTGTPKIIGLVDSEYLYERAGVGGPWNATGLVHSGSIGITPGDSR